MKRSEKGRALFYTRDSGGKHENTPSEYVEWARRQAADLNLSFNGTPDGIERMIQEGRSLSGDVFLDYDVKGNQLSRKGLDALIKEALSDRTVSHVCIPRRNRLARPDDVTDGIKLENLFRKSGITLVFMDRTCPPLRKGSRQDIADLILAVMDYDRSAEDRRELAQKAVYAQIRLAKLGFSTGGRAPYGFRRWLAKEDGTSVRPLGDGECVKMQGHHVVWIPGPEKELTVIRRILEMLETMPANRVAARLTAEGVPSPGAGRWRTDRGVPHQVSGVWHQTTVNYIARNPLLVAISSYGTRSMGDQLRYTPDGPRELEEEDFRSDEKPKVIRNSDEDRIRATATFEPLVDVEQQKRLISKLDQRAGTQRGKPRCKDPAKNPLGCRVFDMNCTWPMYRVPYAKSYRYKCGLYQQSHGQKCAHNDVDGVTATRFALSCVRQRLLSSTFFSKLEARLNILANEEAAAEQRGNDGEEQKRALAEITSQLETVSRNMALAESKEQYKAMATTFEDLKKQQRALEAAVDVVDSRSTDSIDTESEVSSAMKLLHHLTDLAEQQNYIGAAHEIIQLVDIRLFLSFQPVR